MGKHATPSASIKPDAEQEGEGKLFHFFSRMYFLIQVAREPRRQLQHHGTEKEQSR